MSYAARGGPAGRPGAGSGGDLARETPSPGAFTVAQPGGRQLGPQCSLPSWLLVNFFPASSPHRGSLGAPKLSLKQIRQQDGRLGPGAKPEVTIEACFPRYHCARPEELPTPMAPFVGEGSQVTTSYQGAPEQWLLPLCRLGLLGRQGETGGGRVASGSGEQALGSSSTWEFCAGSARLLGGVSPRLQVPPGNQCTCSLPGQGWGGRRGPQSCRVTGWVLPLQFVSMGACLSQGAIPWETGLPEALLEGPPRPLLCRVSWAVLWVGGGRWHSLSSGPRMPQALRKTACLGQSR